MTETNREREIHAEMHRGRYSCAQRVEFGGREREIDRQCHRGADRARLMHRDTGETGIHRQQHADAERDLQRLTEADRDSQRDVGICIEMQ